MNTKTIFKDKVLEFNNYLSKINIELPKEFESRNTNIDNEKLNKLVNACIKFSLLNVSKNKIVKKLLLYQN